MSFNRYARRADKSTQKIVDEMRALGFTCEYINRPVDLAITHAKYGPNVWKFAEVKSNKKADGSVRLRSDQKKQNDFCAQHGVPQVTDTFELLLALGETISL
jgi:hypothetical protein